VDIELRGTAQKIADFGANGKAGEAFDAGERVHVKTRADLPYATGGSDSRLGRIRTAEDQLRTLGKVTETAPGADPRRKSGLRKKIHARRCRQEIGSIAFRNYVLGVVQILIEIEYQGCLEAQRRDAPAPDATPIVH